jgi:hypothetical protein
MLKFWEYNISFKDPASVYAYHMFSLHHSIMWYIIIILILVYWCLYKLIKDFNYKFSFALYLNTENENLNKISKQYYKWINFWLCFKITVLNKLLQWILYENYSIAVTIINAYNIKFVRYGEIFCPFIKSSYPFAWIFIKLVNFLFGFQVYYNLDIIVKKDIFLIDDFPLMIDIQGKNFYEDECPYLIDMLLIN